MKCNLLLVCTLLFFCQMHAQTEAISEVAYIETTAHADTLVLPDKIFLRITLSENDNNNKTTLEDLESNMMRVLQSLQIDCKNQLSVVFVTSNFRKKLLKRKDIILLKVYELQLADQKTVDQVMEALEAIDVSNVSMRDAKYSKEEALTLALKLKAIQKARLQAEAMAKALRQNIGEALIITNDEGINASFVQSLQGRVPGLSIRGASSITTLDQEEIDIQKLKYSAKVKVRFRLLK